MNPTLKNTNLVRVKYVVTVVKTLQTRIVSDNMTLRIKEVYISLFEISVLSKVKYEKDIVAVAWFQLCKWFLQGFCDQFYCLLPF